MAENSNINNKVTFWNNEAIEPSQFTFDSGNTNTYIITKTGLDKNGIYFNSASSYPHIIYNNKVFTVGSRINKVTKKDIQTQYIPNENSETVNVITDIVTDPISRTIDYKYSTIDIGYLYSEISRLWVEVNRESKPDELTFTPQTLSNCLIGDINNNVTWKTTTNKKPILVSKTGNITNCTVNDDGTLSITFASELPNKDVHTSEEKIVLKSQQGQTDGINYISQQKTISATLKKHEYVASLSGVPSTIAFNGQSIVRGSFSINFTSCDPEGEIIVSSSDTSRLKVGMNEDCSSYKITIGDKKSFTIYYEAVKIGIDDITVTVTPSNTTKYYVTTDLQNKLKSDITLSEGTISVTGISLSQTSATLTGKNDTLTLTTTITPNDATNKSVKWTSSNESVAKVVGGVVTPLKASQTPVTITATTTDGSNKSASCAVTVKEGTTTWTLDPLNASIVETEPITFSMTVDESNTFVTPDDSRSTWTVQYKTNDNTYAGANNILNTSVGSSVVATGPTVPSGSTVTYYINVLTSDSTSKTTTLVVASTAVSVTSIALNKTSATLTGVNSSTTITATVLPANATNNSVSWNVNSSDSAITYTPNGNTLSITSNAKGTATIVALAEGKSSPSCTVTVNDGSVSSIALSPATYTLSYLGGKVTITPKISENVFGLVTVTWNNPQGGELNKTSTTGNSSIEFTAPGNSTTTVIQYNVTATCGGKSAECTITVGAKPQETMYYWYAGWTEPTESNIASIINEEYPVSKTDSTSNKAGGSSNTNSGYSVNELFASITTNRYYSTEKTNYYIVVPNNMGIYASASPSTSVLSTFTEHCRFNNHIVYKSNAASRNIIGFVIY